MEMWLVLPPLARRLSLTVGIMPRQVRLVTRRISVGVRTVVRVWDSRKITASMSTAPSRAPLKAESFQFRALMGSVGTTGSSSTVIWVLPMTSAATLG